MTTTTDFHACSAKVYDGGSYSYRGRSCHVAATVQRTRTEPVTERVQVYDEQAFEFTTERRDLGTKDVQEWFCSRHDPEAAARRRNKKDEAERAERANRETRYKTVSGDGANLFERLKALGIDGVEQAYTSDARGAYRHNIRPALTLYYSGIKTLLDRLEDAERKVREYEAHIQLQVDRVLRIDPKVKS